MKILCDRCGKVLEIKPEELDDWIIHDETNEELVVCLECENKLGVIELGPSPIESAAQFIVLHESLVHEIASIYGVPLEYLEPSYLEEHYQLPTADSRLWAFRNENLWKGENNA